AIPSGQFLHQPCPAANHPLWTMAHLATVDQYFLKTLAVRDGTLLDQYRQQFFAKSHPTPAAASYPPLEGVTEDSNTSRAAFRAWIESLTDEELSAPFPEERQRLASTLGNFLTRLIWHEGMHYGQLTVIRKSLGLAPIRI